MRTRDFGSVCALPAFAIFALFQRLWFRCVWIVQEVVLARSLILICGGSLLHWSAIELVVPSLKEKRLYDELSEFAVGLMRGGPVAKIARQHARVGGKVYGSAPETGWDGKLLVDSKGCCEFVEGVGRLRRFLGRNLFFMPKRAQMDSCDPHPQEPESDNEGLFVHMNPMCPPELTFPLEYLLCLFRCCNASDSRDKIFSLLGILGQTQSPILDIPRDYRISMGDLYVATVTELIKTSNRLDILAQVQDPSLTKVSGLPSWVPDFSVDSRPAFSAGHAGRCSLRLARGLMFR